MGGELKIGIIGAKFAGSFHVECWKAVPGSTIVAVADIDEKARKDFRARYEIPKGYEDYHKLLDDSEVEVVDICLPNFLHAEVAVAAMQAGKHVVCEKPFATSLRDGERIVETQAKTGCRYFYAEDWIFAPSLVRAKDIIAEGGIGKPLYLKGKESHFGSHSPFAREIRYCGGGCVIHLAVHPIGFFHHLLGKPATVLGKCSGGGKKNLFHREFEGEDWGIGILTYDEGVQVVVEGNYVTRGGMDDFVEIYGSSGVIKADLTFGSPLSVFSAEGYGYAVEKADFTHGWTRPALDEHHSLGYKDELAHFKACILGEAEQVKGTSAEDGFQVLRIIDAIYRSDQEGRRIELNLPGE
jgi:predicted dehydrogenase